MTNVGIMGLGNMGRLHMMNCLHIKDVKVVAAADQSRRLLEKAKSIGVKNLYDDYRELLSTPLDLDAVIISLPNFLHFESVQSALEAGLDVFVEKPLANTVEECIKISKLVGASNKKLMIGHCMRFIDAVEKMKDASDRGTIGTLEVVTIEEVMNGPFAHAAVPSRAAEWWFDPSRAGGGVLLDIGYHLIDLFRFFVGDCRVVFSSLGHKFNLPVEDGAIVVLQSTESSTKGIINVGWYQKIVFPNVDFRLILHGNAGYLASDDLVPKHLYRHAAKEGMKNFLRKLFGRKLHPLSYTYYYEAYYRELKHFFDSLEQDKDPSISAVDGLKAVEIIEEAYKLCAGANG